MQDGTLELIIFGGGALLSLLGWLLRQRIAAQEKENERLGTKCERSDARISELERTQRDLVTRQELDEYKRDTTTMIEALRSGIKADLENIRRNEIRELHDILRQETRETRSELREDFTNGMNSIREQLLTLQTHLAQRS